MKFVKYITNEAKISMALNDVHASMHASMAKIGFDMRNLAVDSALQESQILEDLIKKFQSEARKYIKGMK